MITLDDILRDLTYGEFSQLEFGQYLPEEHESEMDPKSYDRLCRWINLSLKAIYAEFLLQSREIFVQPQEEIDEYILSYDYAVSNPASPGQPIRYIIDTAENPFLDDILKIEEVYDEGGNKLFLNDSDEDLSIFTPSYRSIQVPWPNEFNTLSVMYRGMHTPIVYAPGMDPSAIEVEIPHALHEALLYAVAARGFASINTDQGQEGNDYYRKFEARIGTVRKQGLYIQAEQQNTRFANNGFV